MVITNLIYGFLITLKNGRKYRSRDRKIEQVNSRKKEEEKRKSIPEKS